MATPLTDSINALTTYANEVTGGSDTNLSDAVHTLASGYGQGENWLSKVQSLYHLLDSQELQEDAILDFEGNIITKTAEYFLYKIIGAKTVTIKNLTISSVMAYAFQDASCETLEFVNCTIQPTRCNRMFTGSNLRYVIGEIDMSKCTQATDPLYYSRNLEEIRFKKDTIQIAFTLAGLGNLSDDSYVSIGNALTGTSSHTLDVDNASERRIASIMGTNSDGTFVADENGTMSLADFITNVKGWTLT